MWDAPYVEAMSVASQMDDGNAVSSRKSDVPFAVSVPVSFLKVELASLSRTTIQHHTYDEGGYSPTASQVS